MRQTLRPARVKRVESHLGIILQKRRWLHICITFACVNTSAEARTLSSYPIYLGERTHLHTVCMHPPPPCLMVIAQMLVTNNNDLFRCAHIICVCIEVYCAFRVSIYSSGYKQIQMRVPFLLRDNTTHRKKAVMQEQQISLFSKVARKLFQERERKLFFHFL